MNLSGLSERIAARLAERNPFDPRRVRPGMLPFRFGDGQTAALIIEALRRNDWNGEIVGARGSGKSSLVCTLLPLLREAGRDVKLFMLRPGESRLCIVGSDLQTWNEATQVAVDGYDQLGGWTRKLLARICGNQGCGLLRTSLEPTASPLLCRTRPTLDLVQAMVRDLQSNGEPRIVDSDVTRSYEFHRGNVREVLLDLHDLYEQRRG